MLLRRKVKIIKYWVRLLHTKNCILKAIYDDMYDRCNSNNATCWLCNVKCMLFELGFGDGMLKMKQMMNYFLLYSSKDS